MMAGLIEGINTLASWMFEAKHLVVFTGAGISTESSNLLPIAHPATASPREAHCFLAQGSASRSDTARCL